MESSDDESYASSLDSYEAENIDNVYYDDQEYHDDERVNNNYYIVDGRDSMSHIMKGNIGLFCSQSYRMIANDLCINNVKNNSTSSMKNSCESDGILFTGCKDILIKKYNILNIYSKQGVASDLMYKNENINIQA